MDNWPISHPFLDANTEEAACQINPKLHQVYRNDLVDWEAQDLSGIKGRFVEVVHGYEDDDEDMPRTLIVFEWRFIPGINAERLRNIKITVAFQAVGTRSGVRSGESLSDWDPIPIDWAPKQTIRSFFSKATITETGNTEHGAQAGYDSYLALNTKKSIGTTQVVERIDYRYITGAPTPVNKNAGSRNAMEWQFSENVQLKSGVQHEIRTAVLLRRQGFDMGKFNLTVVAETNISRQGYWLDKLYRTVRLRPTDGPAAFDPTVLPGSSIGDNGDDDVAARATTRNWRNLGGLDLEAELLKDWGTASVEDLRKQKEGTPEGDNAASSLGDREG
ncbi:hypothetical protein GGS24DRAFT_451522 [Hypoxylon argillaceum]|nr:hypothetical protein GGS24DRAFT_451522 [Hypoxylon argillaceum]